VLQVFRLLFGLMKVCLIIKYWNKLDKSNCLSLGYKRKNIEKKRDRSMITKWHNTLYWLLSSNKSSNLLIILVLSKWLLDFLL